MNTSTLENRLPRWLPAGFAFVGIAIALGFWLFYRNQEHKSEQNAANDLAAIASLKKAYLEQWYNNAIEDAAVLANRPDFTNEFSAALSLSLRFQHARAAYIRISAGVGNRNVRACRRFAL